MMFLYWVLYTMSTVEGIFCLLRLRRIWELHHLYWGIVLAALPWWPARAVGMACLVDDSVQHSVQVADVDNGKPPRPDWSPLHRLYVWAVTRLRGR